MLVHERLQAPLQLFRLLAEFEIHSIRLLPVPSCFFCRAANLLDSARWPRLYTTSVWHTRRVTIPLVARRRPHHDHQEWAPIFAACVVLSAVTAPGEALPSTSWMSIPHAKLCVTEGAIEQSSGRRVALG
jgi:hypothetical protein